MVGADLIGGALAGSVAGSVAGAAVERWPRGRTLLRPARSTCASCGDIVLARDLVPVVSWVRLRGRCRRCHQPIGRRSLAIEVASTVIVAAVLAVHGFGAEGVVLALGSVGVLVASAIDLEHRIVPDRLTLPLGILGVCSLVVLLPGSARWPALAWALGIPSLLRLVTLVADRAGVPRPIGLGDVKLLVGVLALAGHVADGAIVVLLGAVVIGGLVGIIGIVSGRVAPRSRVPFAPAIAGGYLAVVLLPHGAGGLLGRFGGVAWLV